MNKIYFDNAATSFPKAPNLGRVISDFIENSSVNINRGAYNSAYETAECVYDTRSMLAKFFDCSDNTDDFTKRVIFTPGITYSLNYFIKGFLSSGDNIIVSSMEHHAVMRPLKEIQNYGIEHKIVYADQTGEINASDFEKLIDKNTKAILVTHASNVCGTILPIKEIGQICKKYNLIFAVDTAQTAGSLPISLSENNIDFLAFTGHKGLLGMQGIGGFIISKRLDGELKPLICGGTGSLSHLFTLPDFLPDRFESGTINLPGVISLNHSLKYLNNIGIDNICKKELELTDYFLKGVRDINNVRVIGKTNCENRTAVVSLDFINRDNADIAFMLDNDYGIMTRVGLHCAAIAHETLGTLNTGTIRFSFGYFNTKHEIDYCIEALHKILNK